MTKNDYKNRRKWLQKQTKMTKITKKNITKNDKKNRQKIRLKMTKSDMIILMT